MKRKLYMIVALALLVQLILAFPLTTPGMAAETRVTVSIAVGGVACGAYFFIQFAFGSSMVAQAYEGLPALFNYGPQGWQVNYPYLSLGRETDDLKPRARSSEEMHVELLKVLF